jgi:tRNA nucleotidyltransferase/poly(A) polymerase
MLQKVPRFVGDIISNFVQKGYEIYIVGGAVRDLMMDKQVTDWDLTTNATPEQILELFPDGFYDNGFGTVGLVDPEDKAKHDVGELEKVPVYEVTTFRKEVGYSDRRHPDRVDWGKTLEEDLMRRDFTINAMALRVVSKFQGFKVSSRDIGIRL